jgi:hypothetical protein
MAVAADHARILASRPGTLRPLRSARRIPRPVRAARNAAQRLYDTASGIEQLKANVAPFSEELVALRTRIEAMENQSRVDRQNMLDAAGARHDEVLAILRTLRDDEPANRQRLWRLRETQDYARAFEEPEPLVSICMATYTNTEALLERALPSALAQTYERIEVVIVGDAASPEVARLVNSVGDPRVRYSNLTVRGPYPEGTEPLWHVAGGPPSNEAMRLAQGRWIASMDDDDESTPDRVELLLRAARERDLEFCYGQMEYRRPDGSVEPLCVFPPTFTKIGLQGSLMHTDMRFICSELSDALFRVPGDWSRIDRMMRIGVRMGMIDDVVLHYYPSYLWRDLTAEPPTATPSEQA